MTEEDLVITPRWAPAQDDRVRLYVIGYDPGVTTGWAVVRMDLELLLEHGFAGLALASGSGRDPEVFAWDADCFRGSENSMADQMIGLVRGVWMDAAMDAGEDSDVLAVAREGFTLRLFSADPDLLSPVRVSAAFDYAARSVPVPRVVQSPSDAKQVVSDDRLKRLNLYKTGPEHPRDALRHCILLARKLCDPAFLARWRAACPWLRG